jgi:hypothetical protein
MFFSFVLFYNSTFCGDRFTFAQRISSIKSVPVGYIGPDGSFGSVACTLCLFFSEFFAVGCQAAGIKVRVVISVGV